MKRRLAHTLVRRYPLAWRERYLSEVFALIDESSLRFSDLAELLRGLLTERARELVSSDERLKRTVFVLGIMAEVCALIFVVFAAASGLAFKLLVGSPSEMARHAVSWGLLVFTVGLIAVWVRMRMRRPWLGPDPPLSAGVSAILLPCVFVAIALAVVFELRRTPDPVLISGGARWWFYYCFYQTVVKVLIESLWPNRRLLPAFTVMRGLERSLKISQGWAAGCREMIAKGVPSPLGQAEAQVADLTRQLKESREQIHSLGYRARFQPHLGGSGAARHDTN